MHVAGPALAEADVDHRADDRPHHLPAERRRRGRRSAARRRRGRATRDSKTRRTSDLLPVVGFRQNDAKSCSPTNGSAASRSAREVERLRAPTTRTGRGTGRAPAGSRSCTGSGASVAERRASNPGGDELGASRTTISGPSIPLSAACSRSSSSPGGASNDTTWPHACTPASVRPAHVSVDLAAQHLAAAPWPARPRPCAGRAGPRSRGSRCRRRRRRTGTPPARRRLRLEERHGRIEERHGSRGCGTVLDELDARHRRVVARARAELQDPQVAAVAVGVAGRDLGEELVRRPPGRGCVDDDLALAVDAALLAPW